LDSFLAGPNQHGVDAEVNFAAFVQHEYPQALHWKTKAKARFLRPLQVVRKANLFLLESLKPEQRKHCRMHSERGQESIECMVRLHAGHDILEGNEECRSSSCVLGCASDYF
jgi:hypothetical protein